MTGQGGWGFADLGQPQAREVQRVKRHFVRAERLVQDRAPGGLSPVQREVRRLLLTELARYRRRGQFPKNRHFRDLTPVFIDEQGTRCAVANLLDLGGEQQLVERIARERPFVRAKELGDEPRLRAWLDAAGLSLEEAAIIQPSYCADHRDCVCSNRAKGYIEAISTTYVLDEMATAEVQAIHGEVDPSVEVGGTVTVERGLVRDVGTELLLKPFPPRTENGMPVFTGIVFQDGKLSCAWSPSIDRKHYVQAVMSRDCGATLESFDENWNPDCDGEGCGCRVVGATGSTGAATESDPTPSGILFALLGAIVARRMARPGARG